jgi:predicted nucleic acid-binding protein
MVVLVDANIILDFLLEREPFVDEAKEIFKFCSDDANTGYIAAHTITNIFYILRKKYSPAERKDMLSNICALMCISKIGSDEILHALSDEHFDDIEDFLQAECAKAAGAKYIITRNVGDFINSSIPAILPAMFLTQTT